MKPQTANRIVSVLATRHGLEVYTSLYALVWGLATGLDSGYLQHPHTQRLLDVAGNGWVISGPLALAGALGLLALAIGHRHLRAKAAAVCALWWGFLGGYFLLFVDPPVTSAVSAYWGAMLAELWVYARVLAGLDNVVRVSERLRGLPTSGVARVGSDQGAR